MRSLHVIAALLVTVGCVALAGIALAGGTSKSVRYRHIAKAHQTAQVSRVAKRVKSANEATSARQGEQSSESESESAETEMGQPGEPAPGQGHEDPAGADVNHECTGNCQE